jgi:hypothetical protein
MSLEVISAGIEDSLLEALQFKLRPGASYVTNRRSVTYTASGSDKYGPNSGTRLIKLQLTGDQWLDPSTVRVMFDLRNTEEVVGPPLVNKELRVVGSPYTFFRRMRILAGGQVIEDIDNFDRVSEMFATLTSKDSRVNDDGEGFGTNHSMYDWKRLNLDKHTFRGIFPQRKQTVLFQPLSGLLMQSKFLPIRYCPLTIELECTDSLESPILSKLDTTGDDAITAANTSLKWQIENVQLKCDLCTLDNALDNSFAQHLQDGKSMPISYNTYISQLLTVAGKDVQVSVSRAVSRLKSVFVTLDHDVLSEAAGLYKTRKSWNDFYSPMHGITTGPPNWDRYDEDGEFEFQLSAGSKLFPEYPIRSHSEAFYQLKKTLGVQSSKVHNFDIMAKEYRSYKMIIGVDTEKVLSAGFTGLNTRAGDVIGVRFKHVSADETTYAKKMHVVLHSDCVLNIRDSGVEILD